MQILSGNAGMCGQALVGLTGQLGGYYPRKPLGSDDVHSTSRARKRARPGPPGPP